MSQESTDSKQVVLDLDAPILQGLDNSSKEILCQFIGNIVAHLPEEVGLRIFDDMKEIAEACYNCDWAMRRDKMN